MKTLSRGSIGPRTWQRDKMAPQLDGGHSGDPGEIGRRAVERRLDRESREVAHLLQRPHLHQLALAQDPDPSHSASTSLKMCEDKKIVWPRSRASWTQWTKRLFHQWVEAARRLVEDKELGSRHEGGNEDQLLAIALRVSADLLGGVEIETLDQASPL